jgi:hypothetical protein
VTLAFVLEGKDEAERDQVLADMGGGTLAEQAALEALKAHRAAANGGG